MSILTELFPKLLRQSLKKFTLLNHAPLFLGPFSTPCHSPPNTAEDKLVGGLSPSSDHTFSILLFSYRLHCKNSQCLVPFTSCQSLDMKQGHQLGPNKFLQPSEDFSLCLSEANNPSPPISVAQKMQGTFLWQQFCCYS